MEGEACRSPSRSLRGASSRLRDKGLGRALTRWAVAHPGRAVQLFGIAGRHARGRLGTRPLPEELRTLLPELPSRRLERARREIGALERRNQVLFLLVRERGMEALAPLVELVDAGGLDTARSGASLLAMWHTGIPLVEVPAVARLGRPAVIPEPSNPYDPRSYESVRFVNIHEDAAGRLAFLKAATEHVREGRGPVLFFVDGREGAGGSTVPFLGRRLPVGRGIASLARRFPVPIVPVTTRWVRGGRAEVAFNAPLERVPDPTEKRRRHEDRVLREIASWFEAYVRAHPERLRLRFLRSWIEAPAVLEDGASLLGSPAPTS